MSWAPIRAPISPHLVLESMINIIRTTPGFPTTDYTDPGVKFNDGLFEAFNSAAGSVMQAYGNLFQGYQSVAYSIGNHSIKAGFEARINRDTTYFGISPNGEYDFGGGTAYATTNISSASGTHDIHVGDPLPDTLLKLHYRKPVRVHRRSRRLRFHPAGSTSVRPRSTAKTITRGSRTRGK